MDLTKLREQIDCIDDKIVELYKERMEVCKNVGIEKAKSNNNVLDLNRESNIIYRLTSKVDSDLKLYVKELYEVMFSTSRAYQSKYVKKESETVKQIEQLLEKGVLEFPVSASVACQGVEGANSMTATKKLFPISNITYFKNFEGVFSAVEKGFCDFGVLPIENSTAGSVLEVYDLMKKYNFNIVRSVRVKIDHCLAVLKGTKLNQIKTVVSHSQALKQCSNYVKELNVKEETAENTALSARNLVESGDASVAVICSEDCALTYGLEILKKNIQNSASNYTRFICIKKDLAL
ncbi:MAG: chorismate mutase, partial [Clostridia bacterium]|nr:chorismate mutase [Clostridia bacterium]